MSKFDIKLIVFDFDGVLAESVLVKGNAFVKLYEHAGPEVMKKVGDHHMANGGVSRFEKFRLYEKEFMGREPTEGDVAKLCDAFSKLVEEEVVTSKWVDGAKVLLDKVKAAGIPMYVASGTPTAELERIVEKRGMSHYFTKLYGSPVKKDVHLNTIMAETGVKPENVLMVGDAMSDYKAAQATGICFIGRLNPDEPAPFPKGTELVSDMTAVPDLIGV